MTIRQVEHFPDAAALAAAAAAFLLTSARAAVKARGRFSLVLAGGRTPETLYRLLAAPPLAQQMPWPDIHIFQGDERCVPPDHPASNYRLAAASLLRPGLIPVANIHRMRGEAPDLEPGRGRLPAPGGRISRRGGLWTWSCWAWDPTAISPRFSPAHPG
jgi:6-phosphogluconolactonase/glucosamine-6-phosphate isomerase/deaminase